MEASLAPSLFQVAQHSSTTALREPGSLLKQALSCSRKHRHTLEALSLNHVALGRQEAGD